MSVKERERRKDPAKVCVCSERETKERRYRARQTVCVCACVFTVCSWWADTRSKAAETRDMHKYNINTPSISDGSTKCVCTCIRDSKLRGKHDEA